MHDTGIHELTTHKTLASFVSYEYDWEVDSVLNHVNTSQSNGFLDSILFVGRGHQNIMQTLANEMELFRSGVTGV